jgi:(R,R)-butanediol dehydrogenase/meso-butanediol dehydrogenase/diacetyl reductase
MKGTLYYGNKDIRIKEIDDPILEEGEAKISIDYCGICATDIEEYLYGPNAISSNSPHPLTGVSTPLVIGHELTGTVVETYNPHPEIMPGQRVVINGILSCNKCDLCTSGNPQQCPVSGSVGFAANGGLAEFISWPISHIVPLPDNVSSLEAALTEPAAVATHAINKGMVTTGDIVAIVGTGTVGMLAMQIAKSRGAKVIAIDTRQLSLEIANELNADETILANDPDIEARLRDISNGPGPDVVIDAAGTSDTPKDCIKFVREGGRVVVVAIYVDTTKLDFNSIVTTEKEIIGSNSYTKDNVEEVVSLLSNGQLKTKPLISGVIGLDDVLKVGFKKMLEPKKDIFRLLVSPSGGI